MNVLTLGDSWYFDFLSPLHKDVGPSNCLVTGSLLLLFQKAKQLKLKKEAGNTAFKRNRLQEAYTHYTEALAIDEDNTIVNSKLYCNRATVNSKVSAY